MVAGKPEKGEKPQKYQYFVDDEKFETDESATTGAQIKARLPNFDPAYQLVQEGRGQEPDKVIGDTDTVDLSPPPPRLYTVPPAMAG